MRRQPALFDAASNVGSDLIHLRQFAEARAFLRQHLAAARDVLGSDHMYVFRLAFNLSSALRFGDPSREHLVEAEAVLQDSLRTGRRVFGPDYSHVREMEESLRIVTGMLSGD